MSEGTAVPVKHLTGAALTAALVVLLSACGDKAAELHNASLAHAQQWFAAAAAGAVDEENCHGLGLLKHPQVTCAEMLEFAAEVDGAKRQIVDIRTRDCFASVCGEFVELTFTGQDLAGNETDETLLLKRDNGRLKTYLYRSNLLMTQLAAATPRAEENEKSPQQAAYDEVVARYPSLYSYPPCYDIRPTSSNLVGELLVRDNIDVEVVDTLATQCGDNFCLALVGNKIATLCPAGR
ncbi:MAG: hypothetical protein ACFHXK_07930 [bacterium]